MTMKEKCYLAMDVGGTNTIAGLVKSDGSILARRRFRTRSERPPAVVMADMAARLGELAAEAPAGLSPAALTVGLPGWIDQREGLLIQAPNMPGWVNVPLAEILSQALGLPVHLENDSNLYALGEWLHGAGRGLENLLVITLGTGVGGGLILEKRLWTGSFASAVEIGHAPLHPDNGHICGCGRRGCLETVASATGMRRLGRDWLAAGKETLYKGLPEDLTPRLMFNLAGRGDPMSLSVFAEAGRALGLVLSAVFNLLGLEGVVVGGGAAGALDYIQPALRQVLDERVLVTDPANIKIIKGQLGEDAPLLGGASRTGYGC